MTENDKQILGFYLKIFQIDPKDFRLIGFDDENCMILITKNDGYKVLYKVTLEQYNMLSLKLPKCLKFIGFQHAEEGNCFDTFTVLEPVQLTVEEQELTQEKDYYFVNASRGWEFMFPEPRTFEELEYAVMMLTIQGYEINCISLITG